MQDMIAETMSRLDNKVCDKYRGSICSQIKVLAHMVTLCVGGSSCAAQEFGCLYSYQFCDLSFSSVRCLWPDLCGRIKEDDMTFRQADTV